MSRYVLIALRYVVCLSPARADDPGIEATIRYVQKLQTKAGGFLPQAAAPGAPAMPTLRATSAGVRTLHYLGGSLPDKDACVKFVAAHHDAQSGGFVDIPGAKSEIFTTAVGLMAVKALDMPAGPYVPGAVKFLSEHVKSFEEIRIAAAGLESVGAKSSKNQAWLGELMQLQNPDGTFGMGAGQARATGGAVVALMRLGGMPKHPALVLKVLREGQRLNGGYGKEDNEMASDLESTYRVMRCFMMLKANPERLEGLRTFIAKCRNEDGGYGVAPGQPSSLSGTYYASIIRFWQKAR